MDGSENLYDFLGEQESLSPIDCDAIADAPNRYAVLVPCEDDGTECMWFATHAEAMDGIDAAWAESREREKKIAN